jgi:hypothetical protein
MAGLITTAEGRLDEIKRRARAHENSAEYHRRRDAHLGSAAKTVSAVVGAGVFAGLVSKLGLDGKGSLSVPAGWEWLYWTVLAVSLTAPALTALQVALHDAEDAAKHTTSFSGYRRLADDMEVFLSRAAADPLAAEGTFKEFSERFETILEKSISLTANAKREVGL